MNAAVLLLSACLAGADCSPCGKASVSGDCSPCGKATVAGSDCSPCAKSPCSGGTSSCSSGCGLSLKDRLCNLCSHPCKTESPCKPACEPKPKPACDPCAKKGIHINLCPSCFKHKTASPCHGGCGTACDHGSTIAPAPVVVPATPVPVAPTVKPVSQKVEQKSPIARLGYNPVTLEKPTEPTPQVEVATPRTLDLSKNPF